MPTPIIPTQAPPSLHDLPQDLQVVERSIAALKPNPANARTHTRKQLRQIAESIKTFGFTNPILIDGDGGIVAGHGRFEAAKLLGMQRVPTIQLEQLTEEQKRAYVIADNKIAENAGWNSEILAVELQHLLEVDLDFDITVSGFDMAEIDLVIEGVAATDADQSDDTPNIDPTASPVSQIGDLWRLRKHRLLCGDARDAASFERLLNDELAQMVFIDPPYNVPINGHVSGLGSTKHREFPVAFGEMSTAEFGNFLGGVLSHLIQFSRDGSIHYVCMDWRGSLTLLEAALPHYHELKNICVWNKTNAGMGSLYRSQHEFVFVFKNGTARHINNVELGRHGRHRSNVWTYPGVNTFRDGRLEELSRHPTPKPAQMIADALLDCSNRNGIVLDSFVGSGTTIIAAERTGRRCYAIEIDPLYVDTAIPRHMSRRALPSPRWQTVAPTPHRRRRMHPVVKSNDTVGYKNPPKHTRFRKGQSGNPDGRPKKKHANMDELIMQELDAPVTITEGGQSKTVTKAEAFAKATVNDAIKGKPTASRYIQSVIPAEALAEAVEQDAVTLEETRERLLGRISDYIDHDEGEREDCRNELRQHGISEDDIDALLGMEDERKAERRQKIAQNCKVCGVPAGLIRRTLAIPIK